MTSDYSESSNPPIQDWEIHERRFSIPTDLRLRIGSPTSIVRVAVEVNVKMQRHDYVTHQYDRMTETMKNWESISDVPSSSPSTRWCIIQTIIEPDTGKSWPLLVVIGKSKDGGFNLVSMHRRNQSFVKRLEREGVLEMRKQEDREG